jgi:hypothetical protein
VRNAETAPIIERLIACRDTLKVVEGQFAVNLQPERAVMADAANALDAYDKTMQRIAEVPSPTPPAGDGWLLEREGKSGPEWLIAYGDVSAPIFSKDANDALRWPTGADAADFAKQWRVTNVVPTEHMWPPPVSKGEKL